MAVHTSTDVNDMPLFLLGYLYFCVAIDPSNNLSRRYLNIYLLIDLDTSFEITKRYTDMENCTQCLVELQSECSCLIDYTTYECLICCHEFSCCSCSDCNWCRHEQKSITLYQINMYILFGFGIIGLIVIYYKICKKIKDQLTLASIRRRLLLRNSNTSMNRSTSEVARERPPPSYNEVCGAPPLYTSPCNMTSMEEAPPRYPGTPKLHEKSGDSNEPATTFPVTQHM